MSQQLPGSDECPRANGMPMLGLGTWENTDPDECIESVQDALEAGYRHVDTAQAYGNETEVGEGIARSDVDRDDVFLATKVWLDNLAYDDVIDTTSASLDRLGTDYVDLLYVHWPSRTYDAEETLEAFDELEERGWIERVGVSNFEPEHMEEAVDILDAPLFANQIECHPLLPQEEVRAKAQELDVEVVGYSPLARGDVFDNDTLTDIAEDNGVSAAQVSLAWLRDKGVTAIPKATGRDHIEDNWRSLDLTLDDEEIERIDAIDERGRRVDPGFGPWN
ncbi:aldo/keto reductase [Natronoarchaeum mannanilyticum]|uniref:Aldo/keto reductase n=1 Tax=Natronoarchaeum mannanilyticum TaxID=926360 RepID=A0AAV3T4V2_9EURY